MGRNMQSRSETLEIWGNRIKNTTGASSNQFIKKVEYKLSEMRIDGGATQVTCFKYKSFLNGRREQKDCFFFQQEILVGMRLLLSQYKCWQKCELLKNATSRAISQGFEHYDFSEKNGSYFHSYKLDKLNYKTLVWAISVVSEKFGSQFKSFPNQSGCMAIYPERLYKPLSESIVGPVSLTCNF